MSRAYNDYILLGEYGQAYAVTERGDLALLAFTTTPLVSPHFFRRTPAGWQMDIDAEIRNTREYVGGPYSWGIRPSGDDFARTFADRFGHRPVEIEHESRRVRQRARPHLARRAVEGHTNNGIGPGPLETDLVDQAIAERLGSGVPDEPDETNPRLLWAGQLDSICDGPRCLQHDARERRIGAQAELIERH